MDSLLLQMLSSADIDWLLKVGVIQEIQLHQGLSLTEGSSNQMSFLVNGQLNLCLPYEEAENWQVCAQLSSGSPMGQIPGLEGFLSTATVRSQTTVQVLTLDTTQLLDKLAADTLFAAHFYQFLATFMLHRLRALFMQFKVLPSMLYELNVKESANLFAELQDSHLDWLSAVGQPHSLPKGTVLHAAGYPIDAFSIVLDGACSVGASTEPMHDLAQVLTSHSLQPARQELVRLARGDIFGEMRVLQSQSAIVPTQMVQVEVIRDAEVLAIPQWRIQAKLLHDAGFALRFYRIMTTLIASKYQTMLIKLGFIMSSQQQNTSSDRLLTQMARAETKFEWMVQRIQTKLITRRVS